MENQTGWPDQLLDVLKRTQVRQVGYVPDAGHARLIEPPGFHYGTNGKPSPLERVREGYGRIAIGHSELNGAQHWGSALEYGKRAGERAAALL